MTYKSMTIGAALLAAILGSSTALAGPIETYVGIQARSPGDVVAAIDRFFATDAAAGSRVFLVRSYFDGDDPATHFLVSEYADYEQFEQLMGARRRSDAWANAMSAMAASATIIRDGFGIVLDEYGEGWPERDNFVMVYSLHVRDPSAYAKAFAKLSTSAIGKAAPGMTRLMENRSAGAGPTHFVLLSAPTFAQLNQHMDKLFASDAYRKFNDDVQDIRDIVGAATYRKVKVWEK